MPFALLLTTGLRPLVAAGPALGGLGRLATADREVLSRARSLYLLRWFGRGLTVRDERLAVGLDEATRVGLAQRLRAVRSSPNLLVPLAGVAGTIAGFAASPFVAIALLIGIGTGIGGWRGTFFGAMSIVGYLGDLGLVALLVVAAIFVPYAGPVLAGALGLGSLVGAIAGRDLFALTGDLAGASATWHTLWAQLSGREPIRNPLVAGLVRAAGVGAVALAQVLVLFSVLVTRIGPALPALSAQLVGLIDFAAACGRALGAIVSDLVAHAGALLAPLSTGLRVFAGVEAAFGALGRWLQGIWEGVTGSTAPVPPKGTVSVSDAFDRALDETLKKHPLIATFKALAAVLGESDTLRALGYALVGLISSTVRLALPLLPRWGPLLLLSIAASKLKDMGPDPVRPEAKLVGPLPAELQRLPWIRAAWSAVQTRVRAFGAPPGAHDPFGLDDAARAMLHPRTEPVFAARLRALRTDPARLGEVAALEQGRALGSVVAQLLPAAAAPQLARLDGLLQSLEEAQLGSAGAGAHPVRDLPERTRLVPEVRRLRVRGTGDPAALHSWADDLRRSLGAEAIVAVEAA
jgi:hypothetical protein